MSAVLVTGATGLTGANVCRQLLEGGTLVRALVRPGADAAPLVALGVEIAYGDVTDPDSVRHAVVGSRGVIHCAALLGGANQDLADFEAVNVRGTSHVLDAGAALGIRVVALSTNSFFDTSDEIPLEDAPVAADPGKDPYTITKLAAFRDATRRADAGQDVITCHPGAIFGPSPVISRALGATSFNRLLLAALRGRVTSYLRFPVSWVFAADVAHGSIAALNQGVTGSRYILDGREEDVTSIAEVCNRLCELAGLPHRVQDVHPSDDPELAATFGPTLLEIAGSARVDPGVRGRESRTNRDLGYTPTSLDDGLDQLLTWLREVGRLTPSA